MKSMSANYFRYVMDYLKISGNELASVLNVDSSLISKWRSGNRSLSTRSSIYKNLIDYLISSDETNNFTTIKLMLLDAHPEAQQMGKNELIKLLARQLSKSQTSQPTNELALKLQQSKDVKHASIYFFKGYSGKIQAIKHIMQLAFIPPNHSDAAGEENASTAVGKAQGKELSLIMYDSGFWQHGDDRRYIDEWQSLMRSYIQEGGKVHLIRTGMRYSNSLAGLSFFWLPLFLSGNVIEYTSTLYRASPINYSIMLLHDEAFIMDFSQSESSTPISTVLFLDPNSIKVGQCVLQNMYQTGKPVYQTCNLPDHEELRRFLVESLTPSTDVYFKSCLPPFGLISPRLMHQILEYNSLDLQKIIDFDNFFAKFHEAFLKNLSLNAFRVFIDPAELTRSLEPETSVFSFLSCVMGRTIQIPREFMISLFTELVQGLRVYPNLQVCITDSKPFDVLDNIAVMVAENTGMLFYAFDGFSVCTTHMAVQIGACFAQFDAIYNQAIGDDKNKFHIARIIEEVIKGEKPE